jgi:acyl dehydratase
VRLAGDTLGTAAGPVAQDVDARWLMAYAAALGETAPEYLDTTRAGGIIGHPLFPVCYEWPLAVELRARMPAAIAARSVHATHDLRLYRRARAGDRLRTTATVVRVAPTSAGAYVVTRLDTVDAAGRPVSTTDYGSLYRGVTCEGAPAPREPAAPAPAPHWSARVEVAATLAHVYTECARIWNPIHTDRAVAQAAGLPDIILHGTATLALAVGAALRAEGLGPGAAVTRIGCRFTGMVPLPSAIEVRGERAAGGRGERLVRFEVRTSDGRTALAGGHLAITESAPPREGPR